MRGFLLCLGLLGCGSKGDSQEGVSHPPTGPTCDQLAEHVIHLFAPVDDYAKRIGETFRTHCTADAWGEPAKTCIMATESVNSPQSCNAKLTPEQRIKLGDDVAAVEKVTIPPVCERYEAVVKLLGSCTVVPQAMRDDLAARLAASRQTWAAMPDKRDLASMCSSAVAAVKAAAGTCPGAENW